MKDKIIALLKTPHHQLLTYQEIYQALALKDEDDYQLLGTCLEELEREYIIMHNKQNQFALLSYFNLVKGKVSIKDGGFGFIDSDEFSVHLKEEALGSALNNDEVLVKFHKSNKENYEGEVIRILNRNITKLVGVLIKRKNRWFVKNQTGKILIWANIKENEIKAKVNDVVEIAITNYYKYNQVDGKIIKVIGNTDEIGMDITTMVVASNIKYEFDEATLKEASDLPTTVELDKIIKEQPNRHDLTNELFITIDGDDAKDFDDAVSVIKLDNGDYLLKVAIADVSEYVKELSPLDIEAYNRGTSVYLPDRVIPMLPLALSNGICSLNEGVNRLVMVAEMTINENGKIISNDHYEGIIRSCHRMTYNKVNKIIEENDKLLIDEYQDIYQMLLAMQALAKILYEKRIKRGSFDFDTTESYLELNQFGNVTAIKLRERKTAEKLIEEFMLAANESVAEKMTWLDVPFLYRVHDEPDELRLKQFLMRLSNMKQAFSYKNKNALPKALQQFLLDTNDENNPLEKTLKTVISNTLIRTMAKAKYQEINIGHYGLASKCYTHFTSPIRRYPDLLVHRLMKQYLFAKPQIDDANTYFTLKVHDTGLTSSLHEKTAETLERDCVDMKKCEYMEQYLGKTFSGMVSSIVNWGMYVTLDNTVEGLVRFEDMPNDYYELDEKTGQVFGRRYHITYNLGDLVKVKLIDINVLRHQITFKLMGKIE